MISKIDRNSVRLGRHIKVRSKISGDAKTPRISVYKSLNHIYVQIINDEKGVTICSSSSLDKTLSKQLEGKTKKEIATIVGREVGKKALAKGIKEAVFDRGGYLYTGRVQCVADGAREAGLKF